MGKKAADLKAQKPDVNQKIEKIRAWYSANTGRIFTVQLARELARLDGITDPDMLREIEHLKPYPQWLYHIAKKYNLSLGWGTPHTY